MGALYSTLKTLVDGGYVFCDLWEGKAILPEVSGIVSITFRGSLCIAEETFPLEAVILSP